MPMKFLKNSESWCKRKSLSFRIREKNNSVIFYLRKLTNLYHKVLPVRLHKIHLKTPCYLKPLQWTRHSHLAKIKLSESFGILTLWRKNGTFKIWKVLNKWLDGFWPRRLSLMQSLKLWRKETKQQNLISS